MKILLVEDDRDLARLLQKALKQQQHQVDVANDGQEGWELAEVFPYDLILLDWMLPRLDGIHFCKQLRSQEHPAIQQPNQETPVLLMTALDTVTNKIMGLDAGADDYVVKPLDLAELHARIRALERRGRTQRSSILQWDGLKLYPKNCEVTYHGKPIALGLKEYQILELLLRYPDQIFSQSRLIEHLWEQNEIPTDNAVRAQIKGLRQKLTQVGAEEVIETVYKLGYRLRKPPAEHSTSATESPVAFAESQHETAIWQAWLEFRGSYLERLIPIEGAIAALQAGQLTSELRERAAREAHTLIGSLGSFGLDEASHLSRHIQQVLQQDRPLSGQDAAQLQALVQSVRQAMMIESLEAVASESAPLPSPRVADGEADRVSSRSRLLIVDDDAALANLMAAEAVSWGIQTAIATDLNQARQHIAHQQPSVVLLDLTLTDAGEEGLDFLLELHQTYPTLPVLVLTARESLSDRVQAARLGCKGFFQKPIAPTQVFGMIAQTLQQAHYPRSKLLVVDDDPHLLRRLQQLLELEDYEVVVLDHVHSFWDVLEQTAPDLVLLDVNLHGYTTLNTRPFLEFNGFDLCQVIRSDPQWHKLPVLFLSACLDPDTMQRGFEVGADDFLPKPIAPVEVLTRIRKRLEQGRIRHQTELDQLTGISNRHKLSQDLTRLLRLAHRYQKPLSLAILDLDHFKQINDQYGHEMGDRVLNRFGTVLKQSFRQDDAVGRWGGEEFVVGLYGSGQQDGVKRLTEVLQQFREESFVAHNGISFQVTFSGGIAQWLENGTDLQTLYRAADRALYEAKAQGRNRILAATKQG